MQPQKLRSEFFRQDVLSVAPQLPGKILCVQKDGEIYRHRITEVEAYRGEEDLACHASKGRTKRTEVMYHRGGLIYVYLIYGMYWMLNFVTSHEGDPQAVLIRGIEGHNGPGKLTRYLVIDRSYYGEDLSTSTRIWVENSSEKPELTTTPRIGIDYAGEPWVSKAWNFSLAQ